MTWLWRDCIDSWLVVDGCWNTIISLAFLEALPERTGYQYHPDERPHLHAVARLRGQAQEWSDA